MVISWKDRADKVTRPIEDMGCVVLENQQISVTLPLLNELVKNNVAVVLCDNKQMPTAMLQCLDGNTTQAESLKYQLAVGEATKKQAWKQIIEAKIKNQAVVLRHCGKRSELLTPYYKNARVLRPNSIGQNCSVDASGGIGKEVPPTTCSIMATLFCERQPPVR